MKVKQIFSFLLLALLLIACSRENTNHTNPITITPINENIILVGFGSDFISAVRTEKGIVIIDSGCTSKLTRFYIRTIENQFKGEDIIYLINTHGHYDHCSGNSLFTEVTKVGHYNCLLELQKNQTSSVNKDSLLLSVSKQYIRSLCDEDLPPSEKDEISKQAIKYKYASEDYQNYLNNTSWDVLFEDTLTINIGEGRIELFYFGSMHSTSDVLVYFPKEKAIFTGDLFFAGGRPSKSSFIITDSIQWKKSVDRIYSDINEIEYVIGAHGQVLSKSDLIAFLERF